MSLVSPPAANGPLSPAGPGRLGRAADWAAVVGLLGLFVALAYGAVRSSSVTVDEFGHLPRGYAFLHFRDADWLTMNPPLQEGLAALPLLFDDGLKFEVDPAGKLGDWWSLGQSFLEQNRDRYHQLFMKGRAMVLVLAVATGLLIHALARMLGGRRAGLIALLLFALSPDFLAHGALVTTDLSAAFAGLAVVGATLHLRRRRTPARLALAALAGGAAVLSKFNALAFFPMAAALLFAPAPAGPAAPRTRRELGRALLDFILILAGAWLVTVAAYGFQGLFVPLASLQPESGPLRWLGSVWPGAPVPLPAAFVRGFDRQLAEHGGEWASYLFGRLSHHRFWYYYLVCMLLKWPLGMVGLFVLGLALLRKEWRGEAIWSLGPGLCFLAAISLSPAKQIGARMALPAYGFFIAFMAVALARATRPGRWRGPLLAGAAVLLIAQAAGVASAYPQYLAYENRLAGPAPVPGVIGPPPALADSNLDWGQDLIRLAAWQQAHRVEALWLETGGLVDPSIYGVGFRLSGCEPHPGWHAVSLNLTLGIDEFRGDTRCSATFHQRVPVDRVGASILIFRID